jgi:predicted nucleotidyltransferase component of viral defense system
LIFHNEIGNETVFKGGTALSKCFGFIERFSEDIDLVVLRNKDESPNKLKSKLKKITQVVSDRFEEIQLPEITNKLGMIRKVAYNYTKEFKGSFGQVRDVIIIEATWLGRYEPYTKQKIATYIYDMMQKANQLELASEYGLIPFEVQVLHVNRTICEKIMSLVRFSHGADPIKDLKNKIRHTYDIHQLLQVEEVWQFFESSDFDEMLHLVAQDDFESFKSNNEWLYQHAKDALLFKDVKMVWSQLENTFVNEFRNLVFGTLPQGSAILATLEMVSQRLNDIVWSPSRPL